MVGKIEALLDTMVCPMRAGPIKPTSYIMGYKDAIRDVLEILYESG